MIIYTFLEVALCKRFEVILKTGPTRILSGPTQENIWPYTCYFPAELDREKIEKAEIFGGYYGIVYSDKTMSPEQVLSIHHSLWQIEESFRISKSLLEARPCFHWKEQRIKGHFFICFLALVLHRLLEWELHKQGVEMPAEQIISALQNATLQEIILGTDNAVYCKSQTEGAFEAIAKAVGLGRLPRLAKAAEVKTAMKLKELK